MSPQTSGRQEAKISNADVQHQKMRRLWTTASAITWTQHHERANRHAVFGLCSLQFMIHMLQPPNRTMHMLRCRAQGHAPLHLLSPKPPAASPVGQLRMGRAPLERQLHVKHTVINRKERIRLHRHKKPKSLVIYQVAQDCYQNKKMALTLLNSLVPCNFPCESDHDLDQQ